MDDNKQYDILLAPGTSVAIPQTLLLGLSAEICATLLTLGIAYFVMAYGLLKGKDNSSLSSNMEYWMISTTDSKGNKASIGGGMM